MKTIKLSAVVLARNEALNLPRCLASLNFCDEIIVIDDCSTDKTKETAERMGARVVTRSLEEDFSGQRNFGVGEAAGAWVLMVDADEEISFGLQEEIKRLLNSPDAGKDAYYIKRRDFWWGREMRFGEVRAVRELGLVRLLKKGKGIWRGKVHEEFIALGKTGRLAGYINHYPHPKVKDFLREINFYSTLRARELATRGKTGSLAQIIFYPFGKFIYTYFILLGFLDGPAGFGYAFFMSFHYFLVRSKLYQYSVLEKMPVFSG